MKTIKMILGLTVFFTVILAIMLAPSLTLAYFAYEYSQVVFLALL